MFKETLDRIGQLLALKKGKTHYADCVMRDEKGRICLLYRSHQDDFAPGKWCLPGGHIEDGEEPIVAAGRELEEETGYKDIPLLYLDKVERKDSISLYYEGFVWSGTPTLLDNDEHYRIQWVKPEDLDEYELLLDLRETLANLPLSPVPTLPTIAPIGEDLYTSWQNNFNSFDEGKIDEVLFFKTIEIHKAVAAYELVCRAFDSDEITPERFNRIHSIKKGEGFDQALELAKGTDTEVLEEIVKGGEGSKGGKIIGHTKSGKPIYESGAGSHHKDFSAEEHEEAAQFHDQAASISSGEQKQVHKKEAKNHLKLSTTKPSNKTKQTNNKVEKKDTGRVPGFETVTENGKLVKSEDKQTIKADHRKWL
jgi:8-oxo-dGTP pyrophosphatase MutT (NUDIX family)